MGSLSVFLKKTEERIAPSIRLRFQSYHYKKTGQLQTEKVCVLNERRCGKLKVIRERE
jgi:hypothetical protein